MLLYYLAYEQKMMLPKKTYLKKKYFPVRDISVAPWHPGQLPPKKDGQDLLILYILYVHFPNNMKVIDAVLFWKMWISWNYLETCIKRFNKATKVKNMNICERQYIKKKQVSEKLPKEFKYRNWFVLCSQVLQSSLRKHTDLMNNY